MTALDTIALQTEYQNDIPEDLARRAHQGTSFVPEDRARQECEGYARTLVNDYERLFALADTEGKRFTLAVEFERYRQGYRMRYATMLQAKSRCLSTMIAGPSNFNTRRHEKSGNAADKRAQEMIEFRERALAAIRKTLQPELRPIMSGDDNAAERLADKIAKLEKVQETMKAANYAIRRHKGHAAQMLALVALGHSETFAAELLKPDFAGRIGFPSYELTNNNANIRRLKERQTIVERNKATSDSAVEGANARLEDSPADNRVRLYFPGKPAVEVRTRLKSCGFRWSPRSGAWQSFRNENAMRVAREIAGVQEGGTT